MAMIPQLMSRIWDGDPNEYFTAGDMRRVEDNTNILARYAGVPEQVYASVDHASQFRFDEAQKLESHVRAIGHKLGIKIVTEDHWNYNRSVSCVDFERWEANQWKIYKALGGLGERVPSDKFLHTLNYILFADAWKGTGPYYQDYETPGIRDGMDATAYVAENATVAQRADEFNARIQLIPRGPQKVRFLAIGIKPSTDIPIKVTTKAWDMFKQIQLKSSAWQGSGPWTQTIDIGSTVANAVIGNDERNNASQIEALANGVLGVSAVNGSKVTIRAINIKPAIDINATVMWSESAVA